MGVEGVGEKVGEIGEVGIDYEEVRVKEVGEMVGRGKMRK